LLFLAFVFLFAYFLEVHTTPMWKLYGATVSKATKMAADDESFIRTQTIHRHIFELLLNPAIATSVVALVILFCLNYLSVKKKPYSIAYAAREPINTLIITKWFVYGVNYIVFRSSLPYLNPGSSYSSIAEVVCLILDIYFTMYPLFSMIRPRKVFTAFKYKYNPSKILNILVLSYLIYCIPVYSIIKKQLPLTTLKEITWVGYLGILAYIGMIYIVKYLVNLYSTQSKVGYASSTEVQKKPSTPVTLKSPELQAELQVESQV